MAADGVSALLSPGTRSEVASMPSVTAASGGAVNGRSSTVPVTLETGVTVIVALSRPLLPGELIRLYDPLNELGEESGVYEVPPFGSNRAPRPYATELQLLPQTGPSGAYVTLDASATYDLDEDGLTFEWQEVIDSYDDCPVLGTDPILSLWMTAGLHSVRLIVGDGETDQRTYTGVGVIPYYGHFPDVPGPNEEASDEHWAFWFVESAYANNIVGGYPDGSYQPDWTLSRAQMAVFVARCLVDPMGDEGLADYEPPSVDSFFDVSDAFWAHDYIEYLNEMKVVAGYPDGAYRPSATVTRDQMAVYIARAIATPTGDEGLVGYEPPATPTFADVPSDHWAYEYIEYAAEHGVVQGYDDGYYRPQRQVSRDQMAVYVTRAFDLGL